MRPAFGARSEYSISLQLLSARAERVPRHDDASEAKAQMTRRQKRGLMRVDEAAYHGTISMVPADDWTSTRGVERDEIFCRSFSGH